MANDLLSFAGWYFLPNLVTNYLQTALYAIFLRAGEPKPAPGSPRHTRDRRRLLILVILAYLLYTIYEADWQLRRTGDFYSDLGVPHSVTERELQSRFRRLTVQFHPDKVPASATAAEKQRVEGVYVQLKLARDVLVDPAKRFAYDRFGPEILGWQSCKTVRDFVFTGLQRTVVYYVATGSALVLFGILGYLRQGLFWRYLAMAALFVIELQMMMRPDFPWVLSGLVNPVLVRTGVRAPYLPFQMLGLLRKVVVTFFIALNQLGPVLQGPQTASGEGDAVSGQQLDRVDALATAADQEVGRLMGMELMPFAGDEGSRRDLRTTLKEWLVQNTIRNDAEVKGAIGRVLDRRRREGEMSASVSA